MNNYTWLQQTLHRFALSSQFMREVAFDVESSFVKSTNEIDNHIFVAGLARSGTTILLNALYKSEKFSSLSYADMPFILAPNLWSKFSFRKNDENFVERAHGDGIKVSSESPEAFEEVFWTTFNDKEKKSEKKFKLFVKLINQKYQKNRYLSKNNQNIKRLELISKLFSSSKILIPYRDPVQHAYSLLTQHKKFINDSARDKFIFDYMRLIGHTEFGPHYIPLHSENLIYRDDLDINHWIEQWLLTYKKCYEISKKTSNLHFVCYEKLCSSKKYWHEILKISDFNETYNFEFKESRKEILLEMDNKMVDKASSFYSKLFQSS